MAELQVSGGEVQIDGGSGLPLYTGKRYSSLISGAHYYNALAGSATGPNTWLTSATSFNGTDEDHNTGVTLSSLGSNFALMCWVKITTSHPQTTTDNYLFGTFQGGVGFAWGHGSAPFRGAAFAKDAAENWVTPEGPYTYPANVWRLFSLAWDGSEIVGRVSTDSEDQVAISSSGLYGLTNVIRFGRAADQYTKGDFAGGLIANDTSRAAFLAIEAGPEPTLSNATLTQQPSGQLSSTLTATSNNGTLGYTHILQKQSGSTWVNTNWIVEDPGANYNFGIGKPSPGTYRVVGVAHNDGGASLPSTSSELIVKRTAEGVRQDIRHDLRERLSA